MAKNQIKNLPIEVLETDTANTAETVVAETSYGTIMESMYVEPTTKTKKKNEDVRDYKKTPEVIEVLTKYGTKSAAIRGLAVEGMKRGDIANLLRIRYQHVNNVLNQKLSTKTA